MDQKVEIKEEPVWLEGRTSTSFDSYELESERTHLKEETKSDFAEPEQTQLFADVKHEIVIEEPIADQRVPCFNDEDNVENAAVFMGSPVDSCDSFWKVLETASELVCHSSTDTEQSYRCNVSIQHQLPQSGERSVHSKEVNSTFSLNADLESQISPPAQRPHQCSECGKMFLTKTHININEHILTHTRERTHCCNVCGKSFSRKSVLNKRMLIHTRILQYRCNACRGTFIENCKFQKRRINPTEKRPHRCNKCGKAFFHQGYLVGHMMIHSKDRPNRCTQCHRSFSRLCDLTNHLKTHNKLRQ